MGSVVETLSPPTILGLRTQVRPVRRSVLSLRQIASAFSAVRGLTGYAVLLTTPPLTYQHQGTERLSGKVGIKKKLKKVLPKNFPRKSVIHERANKQIFTVSALCKIR